MEEDKPDDSDEKRWTRQLHTAKDPANMLEYVPWKSRAWKTDKDPRQFQFAVVYNHCKISQNSLGSMRKHLEVCLEHKCPDLTCGHCAKRFDKWGVLAAHLNVSGMDVEKACRPCFKLPYVAPPSFPNLQNRMKKHALRAAGEGTKVPKTQIQYNSWQNVNLTDMKALRREATRVRTGDLCGPVVVSPARESTEIVPENASLLMAPAGSFFDVKPDDPPVSCIETLSSALSCRSSAVTSATVSSAQVAAASCPTLFEAMAMVPPVTEIVKDSIPQANLLVPDMPPPPTFQDYLSH